MFLNAIEVSHLIGHHLMWFLVVWDWSHLICGFFLKKFELKKSNKFFKPVQFLNLRFLPVCGPFSGSIAGSRRGRLRVDSDRIQVRFPVQLVEPTDPVFTTLVITFQICDRKLNWNIVIVNWNGHTETNQKHDDLWFGKTEPYKI
jgi:hypothetical protein